MNIVLLTNDCQYGYGYGSMFIILQKQSNHPRDLRIINATKQI